MSLDHVPIVANKKGDVGDLMMMLATIAMVVECEWFIYSVYRISSIKRLLLINAGL